MGWTIANMVLIKSANERIIRQIEGGRDGFRKRTLAAERENIAAAGKLMKFWRPVLISAGSTALTGATILASSSIANAINCLVYT